MQAAQIIALRNVTSRWDEISDECKAEFEDQMACYEDVMVYILNKINETLDRIADTPPNV